MQAEAMERRAVQRSARKAAAEFERALLAGFKAPDFAGATVGINQAVLASIGYRDRVRDVRGRFRGSLDAYAARKRAFDEHLNLGGLDYHIWLTEIATRWHRLDSEVRPRLDETGLHWLAMHSYVVFRDNVRKLQDVERPIFVARTEDRVRALENAPATNANVENQAQLRAEAEATVACLSAVTEIVRQAGYIRSIGT
ncbi:hypothetical protein OHB49_45340 (plasmid) [Streptomyces sp. NBC_01717]|uniref:hypothetical protein n=1 Tax=Streptomyces sp. NBC_01717 TaxID=2975918 RepID=UPI002E3354BB|nr:hypothetical protein [Streptomyces sp. NBC_01717]